MSYYEPTFDNPPITDPDPDPFPPDPLSSYPDNSYSGPCDRTCVLVMVSIFVIIPVTVVGCCIFVDSISYICYLMRRGVEVIWMALRKSFEKLFEHRRRPRLPPSLVQNESVSRWVHSPEKIWFWLQQRIEIARLELREKFSIFGQLLRPRPTLPPVQHAPGSRWLQSPQKVWLWMQQRMEVTRMELRERLSAFGQLLRPPPKPSPVLDESGSP